jgi:hypothetical protein
VKVAFMSLDKENDIFLQLTEAFGAEKAKKIAGEIKLIKKLNPNKAFNFIFNEDGTFKFIEK